MKLHFISRSSFRDGPEGPPRWVELDWQSSGDSGRLTAKEFAILPPDDVPGPEPQWQGVVMEANKLRLQYLRRALPGQTLSWVDEWPQNRLELPAAVRLSFLRRGKQHEIVLKLEYAENSWSGQWFQ